MKKFYLIEDKKEIYEIDWIEPFGSIEDALVYFKDLLGEYIDFKVIEEEEANLLLNQFKNEK